MYFSFDLQRTAASKVLFSVNLNLLQTAHVTPRSDSEYGMTHWHFLAAMMRLPMHNQLWKSKLNWFENSVVDLFQF